jgi:hypothetical protein
VNDDHVGCNAASRKGLEQNKTMAWPDEDDEILKQAVAQGVSLQRLTVRLKRSKNAVLARARELGLEMKVVKRLPVSQRFSFQASSRKK